MLAHVVVGVADECGEHSVVRLLSRQRAQVGGSTGRPPHHHTGEVRHNPVFDLTDVAELRRLVDENPWATLVSQSSAGLVASHYPVLLDEQADGISLVTHVGRPDDAVHELGEHELLVIVQGPHGYVSSGWYGEDPAVPTWNFISAHFSGVPEILDPAENLAVLERLVAHFEGPQAAPRFMRGTPADSDYADRISRGTVGVRLTPTKVVAKRKMSQNRTPEIVETIRSHLAPGGSAADAGLAREMALVHDPRDEGSAPPR